MQVCFHRQSFADPVKPRRSTTMGPLMGTTGDRHSIIVVPIVKCVDECAVTTTVRLDVRVLRLMLVVTDRY